MTVLGSLGVRKAACTASYRMISASSEGASVVFMDVTDSLNLRFGRGFEVTFLCSFLRRSCKIKRNAVLVKLAGDLKASIMPVERNGTN